MARTATGLRPLLFTLAALAAGTAAPSAGMAGPDSLDFSIGQAVFERLWVAAPSSTQAADGLGPLYSARSCAACHPGAGRGRPPEGADPDDRGIGFVLRLNADPVYGRQFQVLGIAGHAPEGRVTVTHRDETVAFPDGSGVTLRRPAYGVADLGYGPLAPATALSPRVAPAVRGLGLLERVPEAEILAWADPDDRDGDGVSGRASRVETPEGTALGRFGWKAAHATLSHQNAEAFSLDIGMSTPAFREHWGDCTAAQPSCREARHGDTARMEGLEIPSTMLALVDHYVRDLEPERPAGTAKPSAVTLAAASPAAAPSTAASSGDGAALFAATGCAACHRPTLTTGNDPEAPHLSGRTIAPYTDLLLHDMGDALADGVAVGDATGREWRTAPLWGLNRLAAQDGRLALLHDGRARSLAEAILWHGGEGEAARRRFLELPREERQRLIRFLKGL